ncbi:MAG: carboxyl transferase domain-containing protein [Actinomycetota bacterium]|nr:carboxyl transferase domain-containing protein [Actinomycetota bacterium]
MTESHYAGIVTDRRHLDAHAVIDLVVDRGTWESWGEPSDRRSASPAYRSALERARERTGVDESVLTGRGSIGGVAAALVVSEFGFLGGSIGEEAGGRVVRAIERATSERLPVLALPASGGTRMQEGTPAFLEMVAITGAVLAHKAAGLTYLVYLRDPTTGGVFASWGSLGHVTWAQPSALVGFLGPRVYAGLHGEAFPHGVQTAENLHRRGLIDAVVPIEQLAARISVVLRVLADSADSADSTGTAGHDAEPVSEAWHAVVASRSSDRPAVYDVLGRTDVAILRGDGPICLALCRFGTHVTVVIGHDRASQAAGELITPTDLRSVRRAFAFAADLRLPVVTFIDTPGAELSVAAEEGGLAGEIAQCTAELIRLPVPTVSVLLGQGAGGAALALFPADCRIAAADAWLSPLPPEGASIIVHHDTDHAAELADAQRIAAAALVADGTVDRVVDLTTADGTARLRAVIGETLEGRSRPSMRRRTRTPGGER